MKVGILAFFVVLFSFFVFVYIKEDRIRQQFNASTANWKVYEDFYGRFSLKYPAELKNGNTISGHFRFFSGDLYTLAVGTTENRIGVIDENRYANLVDYVKAIYGDVVVENVDIGGENGVITEIDNQIRALVLLDDKKNILNIYLAFDIRYPERRQGLEEILRKILSTVRFT